MISPEEPEPDDEQQKLYASMRDFVKAIREFDLVVTEEATRYVIEEPFGIPVDTPDEKRMARKTYAEWLAHRMSAFGIWESMVRKTSSQKVNHYKSALLLQTEIHRGLTTGYLKQGQGLVKKWEKAETENRELRGKLSKLVRHYRNCQEERRQLEAQVRKVGQEPITIGSLESKVEDLNLSEYDEYEEN